MKLEDIHPGQRVEHWKGGRYVVLGVAENTEDTGKQVVLYTATPLTDAELTVMERVLSGANLCIRPARPQDCQAGIVDQKSFTTSARGDGGVWVERFRPV